MSLMQLLRRPEISFQDLALFVPRLTDVSPEFSLQTELQVKYEGYIQRQMEGVHRFQRMETMLLPQDLDYGKVSGLSREVCEKLTRIRPRSLGQAHRIPGVTPAALSLLSIYLKKKQLA